MGQLRVRLYELAIAKVARGVRRLLARRRARRAWRALEREARRQGCSTADILFDWSGNSAGAPTDTPLSTASAQRR